MRTYIEKLTSIPGSTEEARRRGRNLFVLSFAMLILSIIMTGVWFIQGQLHSMAAGIVMVAILFPSLLLVKRGYVLIPSLLLIGMMIVTDLGVLLVDGRISDTPFFLLLPIAVSGAIFSPRWIWAVLSIAVISFGAVVLYIFQLNPPSNDEIMVVPDVISLLGLISVIIFLTGRNTVTALNEAQTSRKQAEQLAQQLEHSNIELETQVGQRTAELTQALSNQEDQSRALQVSLAQQQALNETIKQLSLPLIPVRQDVLVVPLIGIIDEVRAQHAMDTVLKQIERGRTRTLILDVTGVVLVDTQLAKTLVRLAQAAQLLGTQTIVVGIRPEIAEILVGLDTDLRYLRSAATLQEGLALN